jgi:hypothetical protein
VWKAYGGVRFAWRGWHGIAVPRRDLAGRAYDSPGGPAPPYIIALYLYVCLFNLASKWKRIEEETCMTTVLLTKSKMDGRSLQFVRICYDHLGSHTFKIYI